jgi:hypothetical protein
MRFIQKIAACLLLFAVLMQLSSSLIVVLSFEINRKYIKENFCINITNPILDCRGKCFLAKKLSEQTNPDREQESRFWQHCLLQRFGVVPTSLLDIDFKLFYLPKNSTLNAHYTHHYYRIFVKPIFHPPIAYFII